MGNFNPQQFWNNVGQAAVAALCSVVYGMGKTMAQAANGDGMGALETGLEAICQVGIGQSANAVINFARGDVAGGVEKTVETLLPQSLVDPFTASGSAATSNLAKQVTQNLIDGHNQANAVKNDPELQEKKETPQDKVDEQEQIIAEKEEARDITNQQANTARKAAYQAAINSGATPAQAQAAADAQTPIGNFAGNYAALAGAGANARANYRERQGYADALGREAQNLAEARDRAIWAAALQGMGFGSQIGSVIFPGGGNNNNTGSGNSVGGGN